MDQTKDVASWERDRYLLAFGLLVLLVQLITLRPPIVLGEPYFIAMSLLRGDGFAYAYPGQAAPVITAYIPPLYAYLAYGILMVRNSVEILQIINLLFLQAAVYALYRFALRVTDRRVAVLTYICASLYIPFWLLAEAIEPNALNLLLIILTVSTLYDGLRKRAKSGWVLGLLIGVQILVRPDMLLGSALFGGWVLLTKQGQPFRIKLGYLAIAAITAVAIVAPWTVRNYIVFREFVPVSANAGYNFYLGNNPWATGAFVQEKGADYSKFDAYLKTHNAIELDRYYMSEGRHWIVEHPGRALVLAAKKFYYHWWHREGTGRYLQISHLSQAWDVVTLLLLVGGTLGWFLLRDPTARGLIATLFLYSSLTAMIFFVQSRHRTLKADPYLILLGSTAAVWIFDRYRLQKRATYLVS